MKVAIIGASYLQLPIYLKARELDFQTIGFAWLEGAVAKKYCDKFYPISIIEKDLILDACRKEIIDGILSIASDVAVTTVNFVASKMGLIGNSIESALYSTNKFLMRERLKAAGMNCPKYFLIEKHSDINKIGKLINYPAIAKPVDRSGSQGVTKVLNATEFNKAARIALEASFSHQAIVEEFIDGTEVSVEIISYKGVHYFLTITDKETSGSPHFVEIAHHQPSKLSDKIQKKIFETAKKGLDALGIRNGASHPEFIISSKGIFVTEIGARMGGDFIGSDLVFLSTGYDFLKGVLKLAVGQFEPPLKTYNKYSGVYFYSELTPNVREHINARESKPYIIKSEINSEKLVPLRKSADRAGYFIYQSSKKIVL
jgi:biotin carboxylase